MLAAGGFRGTTRVAAGSPEMARDICLTNMAPILRALDEYIDALRDLRAQIAARDGTILARFAQAREARAGWLSARPPHQ
jgi:prephenate dehydrogenase